MIPTGLCSVIKNMEIKDSNDRRWLTCITTTLVTLLQTLDQKSEEAHLESYVSTLTVLVCSAPPQASNVQIVSEQKPVDFLSLPLLLCVSAYWRRISYLTFFRTNISRQVYDKVSALFSKMLEGDLNSKLTSLRAFKTLIMSCDPVIKIRYIRSVSPAFFELFFAYQVILIADRENHRINRSKTRLRFSHFFTFESLSRVLSPHKYNNILKLFFAESESCSRGRFNGD